MKRFVLSLFLNCHRLFFRFSSRFAYNCGHVAANILKETCCASLMPTSPTQFLGATKHLYNSLCPSVGWFFGRSVCGVTHLFDDPHVAPYWPTWPCEWFLRHLTQFSSFYVLSLFYLLMKVIILSCGHATL